MFEDRVWGGLPSYSLRIRAGEPARKGGLRTTAGFAAQTDLTLEDVARADVLTVSSWQDTQECPPAAMVNAIRDTYRRGATMVGLCLSAFVLAEAGVLGSHEAAIY